MHHGRWGTPTNAHLQPHPPCLQGVLNSFVCRCVHCQQLAPEYERAAAELASHDPPLPLAIVDVTEEPRLASRYEVINYPTLKVFHNGVSYDYDGPRHASGEQPCIKSMCLISLTSHTLRKEKRSGHAAADEFSLRNTIIEHSG